MTHEEFVAEVAKRLEWPKEKMSGIIETILEVVGAELKMNNPVVIDDFGALKTDIQPEYILVNPETKERYLMPPAMEVVFEALIQGNQKDAFYIGFTPDETLYNDVNSSFSQFEPTLLNEGVAFPGIPEIMAADQEEESEPPEIVELPEVTGQMEAAEEIEPVGQIEPVEQMEPVALMEPVEQIKPSESQIIIKTEEIPVRTESSEPAERAEPAGVKESPPLYRSSRRGLRSNKRTSPVWIPIAGGIAIVVASLFFFKGDGNK